MGEDEFVTTCPHCHRETCLTGTTVGCLIGGQRESGKVSILCGTIKWTCQHCDRLIVETDHRGNPT